MACCKGGGFNKNSKEINKTLRDDRKNLENEIKLLLLGAGESGKSTIAKQMKIIHLNGFTEEERKSYTTVIYNNVVSSMRTLIDACEELEIEIEDKNKDAAARVMVDEDEYFTGPLEGEMTKDLHALWKDKGIKEAYGKRHMFQLTDSAAYYFDDLDRISPESYVPDVQDVLRSRAKTTGIIETVFKVEKVTFKMADVGGQRSERKKWMHCFQDVTGVIFCVALSEYNQKLYEDDATNRMHESLKLFKEICNSKWFADTAIILFLNKKDLFEEKIRKKDLKCAFPEYKGGKDYDNALDFITQKFKEQNENPKKDIYVHPTCATDTENVQVVFNAVKDMIIKQALDKAGISYTV